MRLENKCTEYKTGHGRKFTLNFRNFSPQPYSKGSSASQINHVTSRSSIPLIRKHSRGDRCLLFSIFVNQKSQQFRNHFQSEDSLQYILHPNDKEFR